MIKNFVQEMSNLAKIYVAFGVNIFWVDCWLVLQIVK